MQPSVLPKRGGAARIAQGRITRHNEFRTSRRPPGGRCLPCRRDRIEEWVIGQIGIGPVPGGQRPASVGQLLGYADHHGGIRQFENRLELPRREPGRHRLGDGSDLPARCEGDEPFDRVGESDGDHVAFRCVSPEKVTGEPVCGRFEFRSGDALITAGDRRPVWGLLGERGRLRR